MVNDAGQSKFRLMKLDDVCHVHCLGHVVDLHRLQATDPDRFPFLLQSLAGGGGLSRYDILFAYPQQSLVLHSLSALRGPFAAGQTDFLAALERWYLSQRCDTDGSTGPLFSGGWFVYLGYELAQQIEPTLRLPPSADRFPLAFATRCPAALIVDRIAGKTWLVCEPEYGDCMAPLQQAAARSRHAAPEPVTRRLLVDSLREEAAEQFLEGVASIRDFIREGDVFQVNLSRQWLARPRPGVSADQIYAQLCRYNPAPFAALVYWQEHALLSSSPERLVSCRDGQVQTRPIAGTRPRAESRSADQGFAAELMAHPKERAEHVMLVDLERNDLGRVCVPGSIHVDEFLTLETYAHVHHIVSNISGRLQPGLTPVDLIRAVFPGGTITGCPKIRCMEIIAQLEQAGRGFYTGSIGYLDRRGDLDLNILIRSLLVGPGQVSLRAGAGIVHDSEPERELHETRSKARGMLQALCDADGWPGVRS